MMKALEATKAALEAAKAAYEAAEKESVQYEMAFCSINPNPKYDDGDGMENVFAYGGFHFCPVGTFPVGCDTNRKQVLHSRSMVEPFMSKHEWSKYPSYSMEDFYHAAGKAGKDCDVFYCLETGRLYVPGTNELFGYFGGFRPTVVPAM